MAQCLCNNLLRKALANMGGVWKGYHLSLLDCIFSEILILLGSLLHLCLVVKKDATLDCVLNSGNWFMYFLIREVNYTVLW